MRLMRLCAYALVRSCSYKRSPIASSSATYRLWSDLQSKIFIPVDSTSVHPLEHVSKNKRKEEDIFNIESYAELLNASKRQRLTDEMSLMYRNTIPVTLASEEHYQLKRRFIEKHAKHSLHPK